MDLGEEARSRKAFRDRANQTADAEALRGMGDLGCRYLRGCRDRATADEVAAEPCAKRERNPGADQ